MEHFFSPNLSGHPHSDAHQRQIIERDAYVDPTQTIRGDTVKLLRKISRHVARIWKMGAILKE